MSPLGLVRAVIRSFLGLVFLQCAFPASGQVNGGKSPTGATFSGAYLSSSVELSAVQSVIIITNPGPTIPPGWVWPFQLSHTFSGQNGDGKNPVSLVQQADGSFIGATASGGAYSAGTLFRLPARSSRIFFPFATELPTFSTVHSFAGGAGGVSPTGNLVTTPEGTVYGTTALGGAFGSGTIFKWSPAQGHSVVFSFGSAPVTDGSITPPSLISPSALFRADDGTIYGLAQRTGVFTITIPDFPYFTITFAGLSQPSGANSLAFFSRTYVLFKMTPSGIEELSTLDRIAINTDFRTPQPSFAQGANGSIYASIEGAIYRVSDSGFTPLSLPQNAHSAGNLIRGTDNKIHGTLFADEGASVFTLAPESDTLELVPGTLRDKPSDQTVLVLTDDVLTATAITDPAIASTLPGPFEFSLLENGSSSGGLTKEGTGILTLAAANDYVGLATVQDNALSLGGNIIINPPITIYPGLVLSYAGRPTSLVQAADGTFYGTWSQPFGRDYIFSVLAQGGTNIVHSFETSGAGAASLLMGKDSVLYGLMRGNQSPTTPFDGATYDFIPPLPIANQPPTAVDDRFTVAQVDGKTILTANVLANDSDPEGKTLRVFRANSSTGAPVTITQPGTISIPAPSDAAPPVVTYHVTDDFGGFATATVSLENAAPIAKPDHFRVIPFQGLQNLEVLANDSDADGDNLTIVNVTTPRFGEVEISGDRKRLSYRTTGRFTTVDRFNYTISDEFGGSAEATVRIENALADLSGGYTALVGKPNAIGKVRLTVTKDMALTGSLQFGGYIYRLIGDLDSGGAYFEFRVGDKRMLVSVTVATSGKKSRLRIVIDDGNSYIETAIDRRSPSAAPELAGNYTLELPLASAAVEGWPEGTGFAILTVGARGRARLSGRLGDGAPFSGGADFAANGTLPVFARAYRAVDWLPGGLTGTLAFADQKERDVQGLLRWFKPDGLKSYRYRFVDGVPRLVPVSTGGQATVVASGSRFVPINLAIDKDPLWPFGAMLHMEGGALPDNLKKRFRFIDETQIEVAPIESEQINLRSDNKFGLLQGDFVHPETNTQVPMEGVILQKARRGAGLFQGPKKTTGWFTIEPRD